MKNIPLYSGISVVLLSAAFLVPASAFAASIYMQAPSAPVSVGDTITVPVYLDTDLPPVNAMDGAISLPPSSILTVTSISLANSTFTLWPTSPAVSPDGTSIAFTGGLPGGFTGKHQLLFSIVLKAVAPGTATFTPTSTTLYLNDGKGTPTPVTDQSLAITVAPARSALNIPIAVPVSVFVLALILIAAFAVWRFMKRSRTI